MEFNYQFVTQFINKDNEYYRNISCMTFSSGSSSTLYLYQTIGSLISEFGFDRLNELRNHIYKISQNYSNHELGYLIQDKGGISALIVQGNKTQIFDLIHSDNGYIDGIKGPINYNRTTPLEYQFLDTDLILKVFNEWIEFVTEQNKMAYVPTDWVDNKYRSRLQIFK